MEAYFYEDGIGDQYIVIINPQADVAGHVQISVMITPLVETEGGEVEGE